MTAPLLHHDRITAPGAAPGRWMFLLHGIYGAGRNWGSVARRLVRDRTEWGVATLDLRQHGGSMGFDPPHTLDACAADLRALSSAIGVEPTAILGHSFGGKVALVYAATTPKPPRHVWVMDSTPDAREPAGSAWDMLEVLRSHPGPFATRAAVVAAVESEGYARPVAQWMATNVVPSGDELVWRLDPDEMEELLVDFFRTDAWSVVEDPPHDTTIHFVKATKSSILGPEAQARIRDAGLRTGRLFLHEVESGHWLNADNPDALHRLLTTHV